MTIDQEHLHARLASERPMNWVFTGDSITHGLVHTLGARSYVEHLHEFIRSDMRRLRDVVVNTAISGWRTSQLLQDFEHRVTAWSPEVVALMIGTNDCSTSGAVPTISEEQFASQVAEFVARVRSIGAIPVLQTPPTIDVTRAPERARIGSFAQAMRDVAVRDEVTLVDHYARFEEQNTDQSSSALMNDPFHPGTAGHAALTIALIDALELAPYPGNDRVLPRLRSQKAQALASSTAY